MRTYMLCLFALLFLTTGCKTIILPTATAKSAPGQVKKVTGETSAKTYAPGQQKPKKQKN